MVVTQSQEFVNYIVYLYYTFLAEFKHSARALRVKAWMLILCSAT